jgi:hypothetical protein
MSQLFVDDVVSKEGTNSVGFSKGISVSVASTFSGDVSIGGTLTYEDVTNIDVVGLITARNGLKIGAAGIGGTIAANGNTTLAGVVTATSFSGDGSALTGMANTANVNTADLRVVGVATIGVGLTLADNVHARFGNAGDLKIYHDSGGQSIIEESGSSVLKIKGSDLRLSNTGNTADYIQANDGGAVKLFYNGGTAKFETHNTGVKVTGIATVTEGLDINGDSKYLKIGAGGDLQLFHNGSNSLVKNTTGDLAIEGDSIKLRSATGGEAYITATLNGSVDIYHNDSKKIETTSSGAITSGIHTVTVGTDLDGYKVEEGSTAATSLNGEFDYELENGHVQRYSAATGGNYFPDFRVSSSQSLSSVMDVGDVVTCTLIVASSSHYCTTGVKIDNSTSNIDLDWVGGSAPSAANGSGFDIYSFTIMKTAATPAYHIIGNASGAA